MTVSAILLAAGRGRRMGHEANKVFLSVAGMPILARAASALARFPGVGELVVVAHPDELGTAAAILPPLDLPVRVIAGGALRHDSACAGAAAAAGDLLLVHDAARPFPSVALIGRVVEGARRSGACIPVICVVDTLRRLDRTGWATADFVDRENLVRVQTPQGFRTDLLRRAFAAWKEQVPPTDDAAAVLAYGAPVATVEGDIWNIKITTPADLESAARVALGGQET